MRNVKFIHFANVPPPSHYEEITPNAEAFTLIDTIDKILTRRCADYNSTRFTKTDISHFGLSSSNSSSSSRRWVVIE